MKGLILPLAIGIAGLFGGAAAGFFLRPEAEVDPAAEAPPEEPMAPPEFARLSNQFVVPIMEGDRISGLVVLSLSLEVAPGSTAAVHAQEPKLRDAFLQVLFNHANSGGFRGNFTESATLAPLRRALLETADDLLPGITRSVLIGDIVRQDS